MKFLVLGGGASGTVSAINLKRLGHDVTIIEKNKNLGKKLLITGNGRCNYFNSDFNYTKYFSNNENILKQIINDKNKEKALKFFDSIGIVPSIKDGYYYPYSNKSETFNYCLINTVKALGIKTILEAEVKKIEKDDKFTVYYNDEKVKADALVISMGSKCYPKTGSTGDSYKFLKDFGHSINNVYPALVPLKTNDKITKQSGVRTSVKASLIVNEKCIYSDKGILQINTDSISGICILNISGLAVKNLNENKKVVIKINFLDELGITDKNAITYLENIYNKTDKKTLYSILEGILNYKLVNYLFDKEKLDKDKDFNKFTEKEKSIISNFLTNYLIEINGYDDFNKSQTVGGGIPLNEIDPNTMESLKIKNLFLTGELLDTYGICGGYNLGFSFITGLLVNNK